MSSYVKLFLDAFDGESADMKMLAPAYRYVWFALIAFARRYPPHGFLSVGVDENGPIPASIGRLAQWADVAKSSMHKAIQLMLDTGMLHIDKRRKVQCIEVVNWKKWQVDNGLEEVPDSVRVVDDSVRVVDDSVRVVDGYLSGGTVRDVDGTPDEANGDRASGQVQLSGETVHTANALEKLEKLRETTDRPPQGNPSQHLGAGELTATDVVVDYQDSLNTIEAMLRPCVKQDGGAPVAMTDGVNAVLGPYSAYALDAAIITAERFRGKPAEWTRVHAFLLSTASRRASDAREAEAADPRLAEFVRIYGPNPRKSPDHHKQHEWETHLKLYRRDPLIYLLENPRFREKAAAQGLWNHDTDIDRATARYREREAELVKQGRMLPD
jgi:hypothetical protein